MQMTLRGRLLRAELRAHLFEHLYLTEFRIHRGAEHDVIERLVAAGVQVTDSGELTFPETGHTNMNFAKFIAENIRPSASHLFA